jgi:hypothetical protein
MSPPHLLNTLVARLGGLCHLDLGETCSHWARRRIRALGATTLVCSADMVLGLLAFMGCTPLQHAAARLDREMVDVLLKGGANPNEKLEEMRLLQL